MIVTPSWTRQAELAAWCKAQGNIVEMGNPGLGEAFDTLVSSPSGIPSEGGGNDQATIEEISQCGML